MKKKKKEAPEQKEKPFKTEVFSALKKIIIPEAKKEPLAKISPPKKVEQVEATEEEIFMQAMSGVKPVSNIVAKVKKEPNPPKKENKVVKEALSDDDKNVFLGELSKLKLQVTFSETPTIEEEIKPVSDNRLKLLKKGVIKVERQLDLHRLTKDEALLEVERFVKSAYLKKERAVLIITGKGLHSEGEPVLKSALFAWVRDAGKYMVSECMPAPSQMGGDGAILLFLKHKPEKKSATNSRDLTDKNSRL